MMTTIDIKLTLPKAMLAELQQEAQRRKVSLDSVVSEMLTDYFDDPDDPSEDEILARIRAAFEDDLMGRVRPAEDVLAELRRELKIDADES